MEFSERKKYLEEKNGKGWTPLFLAVLGERCHVVKDFLDLGSDVNAIDNEGVSALHFAVYHGLEEITTLLIDRGADIHVKAKNGDTPLSDTMKRNHENIVSLLIAKGAQPNE